MKTKINIYECKAGHQTITRDVDDGTTPMIMMCKHIGNHHHCTEMAYSKFYKVDQKQTPTHEWYKPKDLKKVSPRERPHVEMGGLLLRKIEPVKV